MFPDRTSMSPYDVHYFLLSLSLSLSLSGTLFLQYNCLTLQPSAQGAGSHRHVHTDFWNATAHAER
jgi:hypothetical protein